MITNINSYFTFPMCKKGNRHPPLSLRKADLSHYETPFAHNIKNNNKELYMAAIQMECCYNQQVDLKKKSVSKNVKCCISINNE